MTKTSAMLKMLALAVPMFLLLLHGQSDDGSKFTVKLLHNRYGLSVRNGELSGTGAPVLQSAIARSRFVLLGEEHGIAETPKFWIGVCNAAGPAGFHTMAIEEGPWARQPDGQAQLAAFSETLSRIHQHIQQPIQKSRG